MFAWKKLKTLVRQWQLLSSHTASRLAFVLLFATVTEVLLAMFGVGDAKQSCNDEVELHVGLRIEAGCNGIEGRWGCAEKCAAEGSTILYTSWADYTTMICVQVVYWIPKYDKLQRAQQWNALLALGPVEQESSLVGGKSGRCSVQKPEIV
jgi:hypothetical protein